MVPSLTVRGPYKGYSGHDCHVRNFVRCLVGLGVQVGLMDIPHWSPAKLPSAQCDPWFDQLAEPVPSAVALHFCMPHQVRPLAGKLTINFTMFEATCIPQVWVDHNLRHDLVVVPTESSRRAWLESGYPADRIMLCPLGVDGERFHPGVEPLDLLDERGRRVADYRARFLNVSEVIPRKNLLSLLRVWISNTHADDDAILIMKINHVNHHLCLIKFLRDLCFLEQEIGKSRMQAASLLFLDETFSDHEMPRLYTTATHYWSMSYGEGWDQPMTEAGAARLSLIAPDHSAYRQYLDPTIATLLPCREVPAVFNGSEELQRLFVGAKWWRPDEQAAGVALRNAIAGAGDPSSGARDRLLRDFSWKKATLRLVDILAKVHVG
jgi:glycosyltransferase involved in cell wall biosynthesis